MNDCWLTTHARTHTHTHTHIHIYIYIYIYIYEQDLVLNNPQGLICPKTQPNLNNSI